MTSPHSTRRSLWPAAILACVLSLGASAWAQTPVTPTAVPPAPAAVTAAPATAAVVAPKGPPANFVAPAAPQADESNAVRAKTQPGNNAPFWRNVRESGDKPGVVSLPGAEQGVLVQSFVRYPGSDFTTAGEAWRQVRNNWIIPYGGSLMLLVLAAVGLFYFSKGPMGGHEVNTGRVIERFTYLERVAHWSTAITFVVLAISGIVLAFGKFFLLPIMGATLFGWLSYALKNAHNFAGPLFAVSLVVFAVLFVKDNLPKAHDMGWLAKGGGMLSGEHVPSGKFNAGEKFVFWGGVIVLGLVVTGSGLVLNLLIPGWGDTRGEMQVAHMVHAIASVLMMAMFIGHIYMGTIGVSGALKAMKTGYVDEAWAKEHHELWLDDVRAGRVPARRSTAALAGAGRTSAQT